MSAEMISIGALGVMFVVATVLPINIGILAFIGSFVVGTASLGLSEDEIFKGFPVSLFVTIVGVTYLFSVAQRNGTIDLLVQAGVKLVRGKVALIPWVLFGVAAVLVSWGDRRRDHVGEYYALLAAAGGWIYWQEKRNAEAAAQSEELHAVLTDISAGRSQNIPQRIDALENSHSDAVRASAMLTDAARTRTRTSSEAGAGISTSRISTTRAGVP